MRVVELHLKRVRQLLPDLVAEASPARFGQDHPQVGIARQLAFGYHLVERPAQGRAAAGRQLPAPAWRRP